MDQPRVVPPPFRCPPPEIRVARIFNTYGPRMNLDDGRVVSNFIAQAIRCVPT